MSFRRQKKANIPVTVCCCGRTSWLSISVSCIPSLRWDRGNKYHLKFFGEKQQQNVGNGLDQTLKAVSATLFSWLIIVNSNDLHIFLPHKSHLGRPHCWQRISSIKQVFIFYVKCNERVTSCQWNLTCVCVHDSVLHMQKKLFSAAEVSTPIGLYSHNGTTSEARMEQYCNFCPGHVGSAI